MARGVYSKLLVVVEDEDASRIEAAKELAPEEPRPSGSV